ncbi:outer membrane lipid asymmetry maintenance protein MlaD [Glaciecola sp. KUL10]|uniref:outer membrane lipid asymmetry maintenance protein MlaD n=1 Tax=Glaciecola sp. (strain KUL10) TaxID=2161813 RepID=UPI000D785232|nr:outer membrane lipid asymmetry maintenance protein MlaD [Glaciecola sp. KUL10]GBL04890.1 mce family protein [Glaciecola sp. KUL10]
MTSRKTELLVGLFVALAIAATLLLALKVANQGMSGSSDTYTVYAKFDNIGGLKERSSVKVGGVVVGRVARIYLDERELIPVVQLEISTDYIDTFPETSSVSILTAGLLGEQYVGLQPGFIFPGEDPIYLEQDSFIVDTKSALVLEDLIGQFLFSRDSE